MPTAQTKFSELLARIRSCRTCEQHLAHGPRPIIRAAASAQLLIIGQAPGTRVHASGIPWDDRSGDRLREWTSLGKEAFYDETRIAIVPMGFCFPGTDPKGGDRPPRPECAPQWHDEVLKQLPDIRLTLLVGSYAQAHYLAQTRKKTMTETVQRWRECLPGHVPLPHPSWRNTGWLKRNPWFASELVPDLRARIKKTLE